MPPIPKPTLPGFVRLKEQVSSAGGVKTFRMADLRAAVGKGKLGPHVLTEIYQWLKRVGLKCTPTLTVSQDDHVRLYERGSRVARIIEAAANYSVEGDSVLREAAEVESSALREKLEKIREIIEE